MSIWWCCHMPYPCYWATITKEHLAQANLALKRFMILVASLCFTESSICFIQCSFTHLSWNRRTEMGPQLAQCIFAFEDMNGILLTLFHGTQSEQLQIYKSFISLQDIRKVTEVCITTLTDSRDWLVDLVFNNTSFSLAPPRPLSARVENLRTPYSSAPMSRLSYSHCAWCTFPTNEHAVTLFPASESFKFDGRALVKA